MYLNMRDNNPIPPDILDASNPSEHGNKTSTGDRSKLAKQYHSFEVRHRCDRDHVRHNRDFDRVAAHVSKMTGDIIEPPIEYRWTHLRFVWDRTAWLER